MQISTDVRLTERKWNHRIVYCPTLLQEEILDKEEKLITLASQFCMMCLQQVTGTLRTRMTCGQKLLTLKVFRLRHLTTLTWILFESEQLFEFPHLYDNL